MTYYADDWLTVYQGDCRAVMAEMEPESVHCVVTSPPYWGLRDYGTASWEGGDEGCDHKAPSRFDYPLNAGLGPTGVQTQASNAASDQSAQYRDTCGKCGARRIDDQLGLEATPEAFVEAMVAVFREVKRVLRSDGTVWLNLGDSYAAGPKGNPGDQGDSIGRSRPGVQAERDRGSTIDKTKIPGLKPKDLVGIPWRVAFALQADGWYLRSDIIWAKPNPMPESVTDRPTKAHEYLFLLSKSPRYYYDADAVREPHKWQDDAELATNPQARQQKRLAERALSGDASALRTQDTYKAAIRGERGKGRYADVGAEQNYSMSAAGRNLRSVWNIATAPYPGAHFATFPPKLVEPCIKAGTSESGVCPECGAPWVREVERIAYGDWRGSERSKDIEHGNKSVRTSVNTVGAYQPPQTTGWSPSCRHDADPIPATVLDPFAGSGTTGMVAQRLSRRAVLIDLSVEYLEQLMARNRDMPLGLGA